MSVILYFALKPKLVESCLRGRGSREGFLCMSCHICVYPFKRANKGEGVTLCNYQIEGIRRRKHDHESVLDSGACDILRSFRKQPHLVLEGQNNSMTRFVFVVASPSYSLWWYELLQRGVKAARMLPLAYAELPWEPVALLW